MNVRELKILLSHLPDDLEVLNQRYSDYQIVVSGDFSVVEGVEYKGGWVMRAHPTMSAENKAKSKPYLLIVGN